MGKMLTELEAEYKGLLAETEQYKQFTAQQKQRLSALDIKLSELRARVAEQRWTIAGEQKTARLQRKHIRVLENRLEQSTWKLNRLVSANLDLRADISLLLKPRNMFCRTYKQLRLELERQHHVTNELVEKSVLAFDQRSENLKRLVKGKDCYQQPESHGPGTSMEQKREMEHEAKQRAVMVLKLRNPVPFSEDQQSQEGQLNSKIHLANSRIEELQKEILDFELDDRRCEEECNRELKDMESKLEERRSLVASLEQQYMVVRRALDRQKGTITNLLARVNRAPIPEKLSGSAPVTDDIITVIGFLEELVNGQWVKQSLQAIQQAAEHEDEKDPANLLLASCAPPPSPPTTSSPHILAPCEAHQPELEQCSSPSAPSADQKGKRNVPHSSSTA